MGTHVKVDNKVITRDLNRFRKVYRYIRKKPQPLECDDGTQISDFVWGAYRVDFNHQHEVEHYFPCCYNTPPAVIATTVSKTTSGESVWTDADGATAATVSFFGNGLLSDPIPNTITREFYHFKNADGTIDEIKFGEPNEFGSAVPDSALADHASRDITRSKTIVVDTTPGGDTYQDMFTALQTALAADSNFKWEVYDISNVTGPSGGIPSGQTRATFKIRSTSGNLGLRDAIANPASDGDFYDSLSLFNSRNQNALNPGVDLFQWESPIDGTGQGSLSAGGVTTNSNFNTFITDISNEKCIFRTSGYFTGYVHYQALIDGVYEMPDIGRTMEVKTLSYNNTNTKSYTFTVNDGSGFTCIPIVTATADNDVNVFITDVSKTSVTVEVSQANYSGNVYIQAIEKGC